MCSAFGLIVRLVCLLLRLDVRLEFELRGSVAIMGTSGYLGSSNVRCLRYSFTFRYGVLPCMHARVCWFLSVRFVVP